MALFLAFEDWTNFVAHFREIWVMPTIHIKKEELDRKSSLRAAQLLSAISVRGFKPPVSVLPGRKWVKANI